jgi:hypothetical protein
MNLKRTVFFTIPVCISTLAYFYWIYVEKWDSKVFKLNPFSIVNHSELNPSDEAYIFNVVLKQNRISGTNIVALSSFMTKFMTLNWITSLIRNNYTRFVIFCHDTPTWKFLSDHGYRDKSVILPSNWSRNETDDFDHTTSRVNLWHRLLSQNVSFLFSDTDSVFLSSSILDHVQFCQQFSDGDMVFSVFQSSSHLIYNIGFFYVVPTKSAKKLFQELAEINSPAEVNEAIAKSRLNRKFVTLDPYLYSSNSANNSPVLKIKPIVVQANGLEDVKSKQEFLKSQGYWYI